MSDMIDMRPVVTGLGTSANAIHATAPTSPTLQQEVGFLNGLNPDGSINGNSYWGLNGGTAFKWGAPTAGTSATISYAFDSASNFTDQEKSVFLKAFAMWELVANVHFVQAPGAQSTANVLLHRGDDGGAYTSSNTTDGSGTTLGQVQGQSLISIDTSVPGFDLSGSLDTYGGYGQSSIIHEVGHLLGLGHGGDYNGNVNEATDQFSAYDERMWTTMSYIFWGETDAKYAGQYPVKGTNWGVTQDGIYRQAPHTVMGLDILAIQQLYGAPTNSPLAGNTTYGFHTNISGPLHDFFDFTVNTDPVVTLFNTGVGNTLDVSGFADNQRIDLHSGTFSDVGGHTNNVFIAFGTQIESAVGGSGNDTITASDVSSNLRGGGGSDTLIGGAGNDVLNGQGGTDSMAGGLGNDTYYIDNPKDVVTEAANAGIDKVYSSLSTYTLGDNVENLSMTGTGTYGYGNSLDNTIVGNNVFNVISGYDGNDTLSGMGGDDYIRGGNGNDKLNGGDGNDTLIGGAGKDTETGGAGADVFVFAPGDFGGNTSGAADIITDFNSAEGDYIDLTAVDAKTAVAGDQAFTFIGTKGFDGVAGELRYVVSSNVTTIYGDTNGDKTADFAIRLTGVHTLTANDFAL